MRTGEICNYSMHGYRHCVISEQFYWNKKLSWCWQTRATHLKRLVKDTKHLPFHMLAIFPLVQ